MRKGVRVSIVTFMMRQNAKRVDVTAVDKSHMDSLT